MNSSLDEDPDHNLTSEELVAFFCGKAQRQLQRYQDKKSMGRVKRWLNSIRHFATFPPPSSKLATRRGTGGEVEGENSPEEYPWEGAASSVAVNSSGGSSREEDLWEVESDSSTSSLGLYLVEGMVITEYFSDENAGEGEVVAESSPDEHKGERQDPPTPERRASQILKRKDDGEANAASSSAHSDTKCKTVTWRPKKRARRMQSEPQDMFEVEKILAVRTGTAHVTEYYIKWKGYGPEDCTWEPVGNLSCSELLKEFEDSIQTRSRTN